MVLLLITNESKKAKIAVNNGTDLIFIDLETIGKQKRQAGRGAVFNQHKIEDISSIVRTVESEHVMVRVNPINPLSVDEINKVLACEPGFVMLPFFQELEDVVAFSELVKGKAKKYLLFETIKSLEILPEIIIGSYADEIHFGLNDLSIDMGYKCLFSVLFDSRFLNAIRLLNEKGIRFGIGGVGKLGGNHDIPAEKLLTQYRNLGATGVILSRAFNSKEIWTKGEESYKTEINKIRTLLDEISVMSQVELDRNEAELKELIEAIS